MEHINYWQWWIAAVVFVVLEMLLPGIFFLWLGIAAVLLGFLALLLPGLSWEVEVMLFAVTTFVSAAFGWRYLYDKSKSSDQPKLNRRGEQYIGRTFTLSEPIENGYGKIRVDDTTWRIRGEPLERGAKVKVTGVDGVVLVVAVEE